jgi:hypothetical protein
MKNCLFSTPTNLDLFYWQNFTQKKKKMKKEEELSLKYSFAHTCIRKGPGGGRHMHTS